MPYKKKIYNFPTEIFFFNNANLKTFRLINCRTKIWETCKNIPRDSEKFHFWNNYNRKVNLPFDGWCKLPPGEAPCCLILSKPPRLARVVAGKGILVVGAAPPCLYGDGSLKIRNFRRVQDASNRSNYYSSNCNCKSN